MLTRLARLSTQHARAVVIAAVVLFAVAGALGRGVADHLTSGGFEDPSSESERADEALADRFDTGVPNLLLLVTAEGGDVDDPATAQAGQALADRLAGEEGVTDVVSYWSEGDAPPLRNDDGSRALVVARIEGNDDEVEDRVTELGPRYEQAAGAGNGTVADAISVEVGGFAEVFHEVGDTIEEDLVRAETIALPITLVLLVIVFGSLVAASLPLVIGIMSIIGTFFVLRVLAAMTDVSIYALNLTTALGLGLAIDYSLFVVSRYREELRAGHEPRAPFLGLRLSSPDDRVLQESSDVRQVHDVIRAEFTSEEAGALSVVAPDTGGAGDDDVGADVDAYAAELASLPGVSRVDAATGTYCGTGGAAQLGCEPGQLVLPPDSSPRYAGFSADGATYLSVVPSVEPMSEAGEDLVHTVRAADSPWDVLVTGRSAGLVDTNDALFDRLPWALGLVAVITAVLLFMMFGSVVIPAKAIVLNLLSLTATFGAMVWIFQDGNLSGLLDFTATGSLNAAMPILMFCVAFGLSMDYEVFLLSRIKEEHDNGHDNVSSVAVGLERTGRIVTAAAVIIAVVFIAFATSRVSFIKLFGVGLTLAVLLDAFLIRGTLVPAFMRLAGEWNWWAPGPLRRFHDRWGISEHVELDAEPATTPATLAPERDPGEVSEPSLSGR